MKNNPPLISVILPVYNASLYIEESIKSILNQTYKNFELIVIDDGSTDNSAGVIKSIDDDRIYLYSQPNMGLARTLNKGIDLAKGEIIARQDADDISLPQRFEKQLQFLQENSDVALLGTWAEIISDANYSNRFHKHSTSDLDLKCDLLFDNPFVHSSIMVRKNCLNIIGYYNPDRLVEDYDLWSRIARQSKIGNIPQVLVKYRELEVGLSKTKNKAFLKDVIDQSTGNINYLYPDNPIIAKQLGSIYHKEYELFDKGIPLRSIMLFLSQIVSKLSESTGYDEDAMKVSMKNHVINLKSRYFIAKQQLAGKNPLLRLWYSLQYRISLMNQF